MIISTTHSGFSNRVKSLASVMGRKEKFFVFWYKNALVETKFSDLFEDGSIEFFRVRRELFYYHRNYTPIFRPKIYFAPFFDLSNFILGSYRSKSLYDGKQKKYALINEGYSIDYMYNDAPKNITSVFRSYIRSLLPRKEIREAAKGFVNKFLQNNFLGALIRTWSSIYPAHNEPRRQNHFKPSKWLNLISDRSNNFSSRVYIATDNTKTVKPLFENKIGNVFYRNDLEKWTSQNEFIFDLDQFAFLEILVLSYAEELCVLSRSSFGEVGCYYNANPVKVFAM